jgi:hypothetical protein
MLTTGVALLFILNGKVEPHRQWMTRSFVVSLIFQEDRVIGGGLTGWTAPQLDETIVWTLVAFSIIAADLVLHWQALSHGR